MNSIFSKAVVIIEPRIPIYVDWKSHPILTKGQKKLEQMLSNAGLAVTPASVNGDVLPQSGREYFTLSGYGEGPFIRIGVSDLVTSLAETWSEPQYQIPVKEVDSTFYQLIVEGIAKYINDGHVMVSIHIKLEQRIDIPVVQVKEFHDELVQRLVIHPDDIFQLTPRRYEILIADLLKNEGFKVQLTKQTRDGGKDILAWHSDIFGSNLMLVEARRYAPDRPIGIDQIRSLETVRIYEPANSAALVTTSRFSPDAMKFAEEKARLLKLRDGTFVQDWLRRHSKPGFQTALTGSVLGVQSAVLKAPDSASNETIDSEV